MPLSSRSKQLSNVLDPARFSFELVGVQPWRVRGAGERWDECMLLLSKRRSGRMIHPPGIGW
eukprot:3681117-Prymnesium_polylepis.1